MTPDFAGHLGRDASMLADVLAVADLDAPAPSCPGWSLGDLGEHVIGVHRWALEKASGRESPAARGGLDDLPERLRTGARALLDLFAETDPATPCWSLYPPDVVGTWARRQAHETAMHLWDATAALGNAHAIPTELAIDGIAEVAYDMYPRQIRLGRMRPVAGACEFRTAEGASILLPGADADASSSVLSGPAVDILLVLWRRLDLDAAPMLRAGGDVEALRRTLRAGLTP